jgi:hypothetical protein
MLRRRTSLLIVICMFIGLVVSATAATSSVDAALTSTSFTTGRRPEGVATIATGPIGWTEAGAAVAPAGTAIAAEATTTAAMVPRRGWRFMCAPEGRGCG